jgi:signal transduction histidine kinase
MAAKLQEANQALEMLSQAKSEFISIASHQLRTPLSINKGYLSMILAGDYGKIEKEKGKILEKVYSSNERLINLVNDLLNISRIESGRLEYRFEPVDFRQLVKELVDGFQMKAKDKGLRLAAKYPPSLPKINADLAKIKEVVSNLLDNAIKYTKRGGIAVDLKNKKGDLFCSIKDTGLGVSPAEQEKLFQKFTRGQSSYTATGGLGIGLYICKKFIEGHNGEIWVKSDGVGKGSEFGFSLPFEGNNGTPEAVDRAKQDVKIK